MELIEISIDGISTKVESGTTILEASEKIGIKIPTLCYHKDLCIAGNCRICVVEIDGWRTLQVACAYRITSPMSIRTCSEKVRMARRNVLNLLLANHYGDCYSCSRNENCELRILASEYGVDKFAFKHADHPKHEIDNASYSINRDMNKCILCMRCVRTCCEMQDIGALGVLNKGGDDTCISTFKNDPLLDGLCINCGQCINRCPTGALTEKNDSDEVWKAIKDPSKHVVIQTAPAPRAGIGECFGLAPGYSLELEMNTALRMCGFNKVFDTNFTADLTIIEEGTELMIRLYKALVENNSSIKLPQFTSCSPGWVKYIEHFYPELLPNMSSAKSPQQMFGAVIKTYYAKMHGIDPKDIISVALMPCTAKKFECNRPEMRDSGFKDVDYGITTRELAQMFKEFGIDLPKMPKSDFDNPFGSATGSGVIFAATGGVMESALRTVLELVTGQKVESIFSGGNIMPVRGFEKIKYAEVQVANVGNVPAIWKNLFSDFNWVKGATLKVAVCHGIANAKKVLEDIKNGGKFSDCHFIEFMACPGGCIGGGGQPIPTNEQIRKERMKAIYHEDTNLSIRKSYENPAVLKIYNEFLIDGPCGHLSHKLLHTTYIERGRIV